MATIQDVARNAKVGASTVSRVLSGKGYVKAETKERVLKSIRELNYTPNEMARNLFYRKSGVVAIIVPEISHPFFAEFVNAAEIALYEQGYQALICNTWCEETYELNYLEMLKSQSVDGIIFGAHSLDAQMYQEANRPIVALDRDLGAEISCVAVDHRIGGRMAAEELIEAGCKHVLQFTGVDQVSTPSNQRHAIFAEVMKEHGVTCDSYVMRWNSFDYNYYSSITQHIFEDYPGIDGVFATDCIVMSVLRVALERGLRVPEELKAVAYDGTGVISLAYPSVTTIVQPIARLAQESVRLMIDLIQGKQTEKANIVLPVTLRRGETTRRC